MMCISTQGWKVGVGTRSKRKRSSNIYCTHG